MLVVGGCPKALEGSALHWASGGIIGGPLESGHHVPWGEAKPQRAPQPPYCDSSHSAMTCGVGGPGMFLNLGFGVWTKLHPRHSQVSVYISSIFLIKKKNRKQKFSQPRGLVRRSVPTAPPRPASPIPWAESHPVTLSPTDQVTHTAVTVTDCRIHTPSHTHLWVFGSVQFGFLTLQGQFRFTPPFVWSSTRGISPLLQS